MSRKRPRSESPDVQCSTPALGSGVPTFDPGYHTERSKALESLLDNKELCDLEVVVEGTRFQAHKVVLAAGSPHFRAMFTNAFSESRASEVELHEIYAEGFQGVLHFLYSGEVTLKESNVEKILLAADFCEVMGLVRLCCEFLTSRITRESCLHCWSLAEQVGCDKLKRHSRLAALKSFEELVQYGQLMTLESSRFAQIIKSKKLRSSNEMVVLEAVIGWLAFDLPNRKNQAGQLLRLVRLPRLPENEIQAALNRCPALRECPGLDALFDDVNRFRLMCEEDQLKSSFDQVWAKRRWCECGWLYAVGGSDGQHHLDSVERYEAVENLWRPVAPMRTARRNCGVGVLDGHLYAVGGRNENKQVMDNIERYDSKEDRWERVDHSMRTARYFLAVGVLKGKLYIVGGVDRRNSSLKSVECYDSVTGIWTPVASMSQPRYGCGAGVLNGKLYVVGGTMEKNGDYLESVERYDCESDSWEYVASMSTSRYCCGVAVMKGKLYAVGGVDKGYNKLSSVESFDPDTGTWTAEPSLLTARYNCGVEEAAGKMYVVGGRDEKNQALKTVECYDGLTKEWREVSEMSLVRSSGAVAVLPPVR
mmetsp:Transcript_44146/g.69032  ORF Transcript_44146/g.69032 Transcript_44146/m.69032 type:complete len:592 (+) Transcript_44146:44-1819(+)|eukprot:CAMPEP_0184304058 /NCGR_PEP_ID=MMETSP1049-20130417/13681_1 /TAXON_ID=77928 /ORGANISM="Proteomonas sulcata, Strain CCMP704" /LENGTH=591 /DNA_ID=CAMNT_0026615789 /DNA_START=36 /DNA_END=1811 /DNA_ORIENTATION=+